MQFFDTHAHYDDERFSGEENPGGRDALLDRLFSENVCGVLNCATKLEGFEATLWLTRAYEHVYAALGIHPSDTYRYKDMNAALDTLISALKAPKIVAVGEIGLDRHYDFSPYDIQLEYFKAQLQIAQEAGLPAVIHDREAHGDTFDALRDFKGTAIIHSCSESAEVVRQLCRMGHYVSFSGSVTFKNARSVVEAAAVAPDELLLIETDCPYMSPAPLRGKLNHSGNLSLIASKLAEIRGTTTEHIAEITERNARKLLKQ